MFNPESSCKGSVNPGALVVLPSLGSLPWLLQGPGCLNAPLCTLKALSRLGPGAYSKCSIKIRWNEDGQTGLGSN